MEGKMIGSNQVQQQQQHQKQQQQQHEHQQIPYAIAQIPPPSMATSFMNRESSAGAYDLGELDQALFLYLDSQDHSSAQEQRQTLDIFPSEPMHIDPSSSRSAGGVSLASPSPSGSKMPKEKLMDFGNPGTSDYPSSSAAAKDSKSPVKREPGKKGPATSTSSEHEGPKTPDAKTLRRLAQNREAARKSRLRKKAYVQQLESSRIKLTQLEQELHRARAQGVFFGGGGGAGVFGDQGLHTGINGLTSEDAMFDMEYGRWLEEHHRMMCELRAAVQEHLPENELRIFVDGCLAHHDSLTGLKAVAIKTDVFHLVSGTWKTPAERCFMWIGDFRPSDLIKIVVSHIEPLTEQQIVGVCGLQQSTQETEDALTQGLDALHQSLSDTIVSDELSCPSNVANYMAQMALAVDKLAALEGFVRQADNLRHQTLHRLHQLLTTRQAARCFLAIAEYFHRLRALSSLWLARPRQE